MRGFAPAPLREGNLRLSLPSSPFAEVRGLCSSAFMAAQPHGTGALSRIERRRAEDHPHSTVEAVASDGARKEGTFELLPLVVTIIDG